ncbi:MAG: phage holin family protein [Burkholderiales bacterium]
MTSETPPENSGIFDSLRILAASLIAIAYTRLDLLSQDLEEEWERLVSLLIMLLVALFCLGLGIVLMAVLIVVAFWESNRLAVLSGLIVLFFAGGGIAWRLVIRERNNKPRLFTGSLEELSKDHQHLTVRS